MTDQLAHTNPAWVKKTLLLIITESLGPKIFVAGGLQPFGISGARLVDTTSHPPVINSNQMTATIDIWVHGDHIISLGSLESRTEV